MEEAFRQGGLLDKPYKSSKEASTVKREDIDLIVNIFIVWNIVAEW